jgi:hypothetical protein
VTWGWLEHLLRLALGDGVSYIYIEERACFQLQSINLMPDVIRPYHTSSAVPSTLLAANAVQHEKESICNHGLSVVEPCSLAGSDPKLYLKGSNVDESHLIAAVIEKHTSQCLETPDRLTL